MGRSMLEANGVDAMIVADDFGGMQPALGADTGVRLMVRREDEDTARKLLE
ncbi:MAG: putative signal transducing protein [Candidatus Acidiferrales bacterium]